MIDWEGHGFRICGQASDGEEALELIGNMKPDLVITDISMPVMDGLQLIEHSTKVLNLSCHFIVLSGHDDFSFAKQALTCGVLDYWLKPIDVDEIHQSLARLYREWSQRDAKRKSAESSPTSLEMEWNIPEVGYTLFEAEDDLLSSLQDGNKAAIDEAAERLCAQLERSFEGDIEARKKFLSKVLLEISWKWLEAEVVSSNATVTAEGKAGLPIPILPNDVDSWQNVLTSYAHKVADQLTRKSSENGVVWEVTRLVRERYHEPLQLQTIAKALHFQPAYLGQLFKKQMGMSFLDYVHCTRIEESRKLLRRFDMKVADVARAVGYTDPEQFAAKFKQWMSMTPSQYKNS